MNKQLVNVIGAAATLGILLIGVLVFALPMFSTASSTWKAADDVATQNRAQQTVLDTLTAQSADMTELDATVATLRDEIPAAAHLDDVVLLAVEAARENGGTVTTITPSPAVPFAPRAAEADAAAAPPAEEEAASAGEATSDAGAPTAAPTPAAPAADAPQQISVTLGVEAADVATATRILDALRAGPRLVAVTQASVTSDADNGASLSVTLLVFTRP